MLNFGDAAKKVASAKRLEEVQQLQHALFATPLDFSNLTVERIKFMLANLNEVTKATYDAIAQAEELSFATVIQPFIDLETASQAPHTLISFTMYVHTNKAVRDASTEAIAEYAKFILEQEQRLDVYAIFKKYIQTKYAFESAYLTAEEHRYIKDKELSYKRQGLNLESSADRERGIAINKRLVDLSTKFQDNVNSVDTSFEYPKAQLIGLPDDWFNAERLVRDDVYKVTLKYTDVFPILDYCQNRQTRANIAAAFNSRCATENPPLLLEAVQLRQQLATLLGYKNYPDYATELKMIKNSDKIAQFLQEMNNRFQPLLQKNLIDLTNFARAVEKDPQFVLQSHDMRYYIKLREKLQCDVDHKAISEYFNANKMVFGTLEIYQSVLGLKFVEVKANNTWHAEVQCFKVYDAKTHEFLGDFYLDLFPRDGKFNHAAVFDLIIGSDISKFKNQPNLRLPHSYAMVCNFPKNEAIKFEDVNTFFHEFGHVMHGICSRTQLAAHAGLRTETDFVEAPSQMLENWCYDMRVLAKLSAHKTTGAPIPAAMVQKIHESEKLHAGYFKKRQLMLATFDFALYSLSSDQLAKLDLKKFWQETYHKYLALTPHTNDFFAASFDHIMSDYAVGYYGYMYSEVIALDMFASKFAHNPLDPAAGMAYRKYILEPGSSKDADQLVREFLGRDPNLDAFLEFCGLEKEHAAAKPAARVV